MFEAVRRCLYAARASIVTSRHGDLLGECATCCISIRINLQVECVARVHVMSHMPRSVCAAQNGIILAHMCAMRCSAALFQRRRERS